MKEDLEPLWSVFPEFEWFSMGFRMGSGEDYRYEWLEWFSELSVVERANYKERWPEPKENGWPGFYADIEKNL